MLIISGVLYCLFADSKLQSWNSPEPKFDVEMEYLNKKPKPSDKVLKNNEVNKDDEKFNEIKKNETLNGMEPKHVVATVPMLLIEEVADRISHGSDEEQ